MPLQSQGTRRGVWWLPALCGLALLPGRAAGDAAGPEALAEAATVPNEIVITARKREETLRDVPLSVAAFSSDQLIAKGLTSDYDVATFTVGFRTLPQTGRDIDRPIIRGMAGPNTRGEPNASYFIDGVFVSGSIASATTSAVERVEILRGPQSAQFGRATFAGAVNYVTRRPTDELKGEFNGRAGTSGEYIAGGWLAGPIVEDRLYFMVSGSWNEYGGQWRNALQEGQASYESDPRPDRVPFRQFLQDPTTSGDTSELGGEETLDLLGKLVAKPWEGGELSLKFGWTEGEDTHFPSVIAADLNCYLPTPATAGEPWYATTQGHWCGEWSAKGVVNRINLPDFREGVTAIFATPETLDQYSTDPVEPGTFRTQRRLLGEYVQELGGFRLTTRLAWNDDDFQQYFDLDHTETRAVWGLFHFDNVRYVEDRSAEFRVETPADRRVRAQAGLYWYDQDRENNQRSLPGPAVIFNRDSTDYPPPSFFDITNKAVFGSVELDLTETVTLTAEGRYARDEKTARGGSLGTCLPEVPGQAPVCAPDRAEASFDAFTPRVTLRWKPAADLTLYGLVAKGNKPGDFNTEFFRSGIRPDATTAALEGCTPPAGPGQPLLVSPCLPEPLGIVPEEEQWTYELGAKATLFDARVSANLALYYIDWDNQGLFTLANILQNTGTYLTTTVIRPVGKSEVRGLELETAWRVTDNLTLVANYGYTDSRYVAGQDSVLEETTGDGDLEDHSVPGVPRNTLVLGANLVVPLEPGLDAFVNADYVYNSKRYSSATNLAWIGAEELLNLRVGVRGRRWTATAYVRNLTDDDTPLAALDFINFGLTEVNYPLNPYGNLLNDRDPRLFSLNPKRGRDYGLELQLRF
jgi:outer membrane receptor protein involved in Fe transport